MQKPTALIADPDSSLTDILRDLLSQKLQTDVAASVAEATSKCWDKEYDLIITEIDFPGEKALDFIEKVKRKLPNTTIVVLTRSATLENAIAALRLGAIDFLAKPFSIEDIAMIVEKYFSMTANTVPDFNLLSIMNEERRTFLLPTDFFILNPFINELLNIIKRFPGINKKNLLVIRLSIYEMLVNAMEHGNLEIDYDMKKSILEKVDDYQRFLQERAQSEPYNSRKVIFTYHYNNGTLTFQITDEGKGFDVSKIPSPRDRENIDNLNGRGIFITRINMDEIFYNEKGNSVTMIKRLDPSVSETE